MTQLSSRNKDCAERTTPPLTKIYMNMRSSQSQQCQMLSIQSGGWGVGGGYSSKHSSLHLRGSPTPHTTPPETKIHSDVKTVQRAEKQESGWTGQPVTFTLKHSTEQSLQHRPPCLLQILRHSPRITVLSNYRALWPWRFLKTHHLPPKNNHWPPRVGLHFILQHLGSRGTRTRILLTLICSVSVFF